MRPANFARGAINTHLATVDSFEKTAEKGLDVLNRAERAEPNFVEVFSTFLVANPSRLSPHGSFKFVKALRHYRVGIKCLDSFATRVRTRAGLVFSWHLLGFR